MAEPIEGESPEIPTGEILPDLSGLTSREAVVRLAEIGVASQSARSGDRQPTITAGRIPARCSYRSAGALAQYRFGSMRVSKMTEGMDITFLGDMDPDVHGITLDSRQVEPGDIFVALVGQQFDGRAFVPEAVERGAVAVLASGSAPPGFEGTLA